MDNIFQVALLGVFIFFGLVGVLIISVPSIIPSDSEQTPVSFSVWGEWDDEEFTSLLQNAGIAENEIITVSYTEISPEQFETRLVNALARNQGPDVILMPHTRLLSLSELITTVGGEFYSARQFRNSFVEGGEIFLSSNGVSAIPIAIDPLVMYWNRDILTANGYTNPPTYWEELSQYTNTITETDDAGNISTAGIGLGTPENVEYVKQILSALFLQTGNSIVERESGDRYASQLIKRSSDNTRSIESAIRLYTQYANPNTASYAWNNSFTSDQRAFATGDLAMYIAPASDISVIRNQNPNLNFDVTTIPQLRNGQARTYGTVYGFAILNQATNKSAILNALNELTGRDMAEALTAQTNYTPARKDILASGANNAYKQVFFDAAITARGWLDPNPEATSGVFRDIIRDVTSGRQNVRQAIRRANTRLSNLLDGLME